MRIIPKMNVIAWLRFELTFRSRSSYLAITPRGFQCVRVFVCERERGRENNVDTVFGVNQFLVLNDYDIDLQMLYHKYRAFCIINICFLGFFGLMAY